VGYKEFNEDRVPFTGITKINDYKFSIQIHPDVLPYYFENTYAGVSPRSAKMWMGSLADTFKLQYDANGNPFFPEGFYALQNRAALMAAQNIGRWAASRTAYICTGPYQIVRYNRAAAMVELEINKNFKGNYEGQKPRIEKVFIKEVSQGTQLHALRQGEIDVLANVTNGDDINQGIALRNSRPKDFNYSRFERNGYGKIVFVCDYGPTQFEGVRKAIAHSIDRHKFGQEFTQGYGQVVHGPYGMAMALAKNNPRIDALEVYDVSLALATAALEEAGFTLDQNGNPWQNIQSGVRYKRIDNVQVAHGWALKVDGSLARVPNEAANWGTPGFTHVAVERPDLLVDPRHAGDSRFVLEYGPVHTDGGDIDGVEFATRLRRPTSGPNAGATLMPLHIDYYGTVDNEVTDLIERHLVVADAPIAKDLGLSITLTRVDFTVLQARMQRQNAYTNFKSASMFNLATNYNSHIYDPAFQWTGDVFWLEQSGGNDTCYFFDLLPGGLDQLSMLMCYDPRINTYALYKEAWTDYIVRWNETLPELPLYSNEYFDFFSTKLNNYAGQIRPLWTFGRQIVYSYVTGYSSY
jgi:hypothetical protein